MQNTTLVNALRHRSPVVVMRDVTKKCSYHRSLQTTGLFGLSGHRVEQTLRAASYMQPIALKITPNFSRLGWDVRQR